jgi:hypothetical protein
MIARSSGALPPGYSINSWILSHELLKEVPCLKSS